MPAAQRYVGAGSWLQRPFKNCILFTSGVPFCGVFAYKQHVSVEFGNGAGIVDSLGHLEGSGKGRRHIKLHSARDIKAKNLAHYLPLAWEAAKRGS